MGLTAAGTSSPAAIVTSMKWLNFEHEIRDLVESFGYQAESTTPSYDFGVDVVARRNHRHVVIQCKLYGKGSIGGDTIMKLVGSRQFFKATDAICITTSRFTKQAREIAEKEDIRLIDCGKLVQLCKQANLTIPSLTVLRTTFGDVYESTEGETNIGRDAKNNIVLASLMASRHHALLKRCKLRLSVQDNGSSNGTLINGQKIEKIPPLNYFDTITIGGVELAVAMRTPSGFLNSAN